MKQSDLALCVFGAAVFTGFGTAFFVDSLEDLSNLSYSRSHGTDLFLNEDNKGLVGKYGMEPALYLTLGKALLSGGVLFSAFCLGRTALPYLNGEKDISN